MESVSNSFLDFQIFELVQKKSKFSVDRVYIGGSEGKRTAVITADFDCVVFVNNEKPLFKRVLEDFEEIFTLTNYPRIKNISSTPFSIQFQAGLTEHSL